jgi:hypothetical protein
MWKSEVFCLVSLWNYIFLTQIWQISELGFRDWFARVVCCLKCDVLRQCKCISEIEIADDNYDLCLCYTVVLWKITTDTMTCLLACSRSAGIKHSYMK